MSNSSPKNGFLPGGETTRNFLKRTAQTRKNVAARAEAAPKNARNKPNTRKNWRGKVMTIYNFKKNVDKILVRLEIQAPDVGEWINSKSEKFPGFSSTAYENVPVTLHEVKDITNSSGKKMSAHPKFLAHIINHKGSSETIELAHPETDPGVIDVAIDNIAKPITSLTVADIEKTDVKTNVSHNYGGIGVSYDADVYFDRRLPKNLRPARPFVFYLNAPVLPSGKMGYILYINEKDVADYSTAKAAPAVAVPNPHPLLSLARPQG